MFRVICHQGIANQNNNEIPLYLLEQPNSKLLTTSNASKNVEQQYTHLLLIGMKNGIVTLEDSLVISYKRKHTSTIRDPVIVLHGINPNNLKTYVHTKHCHAYLQHLYLYFPKLGSNQNALQKVNGYTVVHPENGILFSTKKK